MMMIVLRLLLLPLKEVFFQGAVVAGIVESWPKTLVPSASSLSTPEWSLVDSVLGAARRGLLDLCPAHAGRGDRHIDLGQGRSELGFEGRQFLCLAAPLQAFDQAVQRPDIVGMLGTALDPPAQAE